MPKFALFEERLKAYLEAHPQPGRDPIAAVSLLIFLSKEENLMHKPEYIQNILPLITVGTYPQSIAELYQTLDWITHDKQLLEEVGPLLGEAEMDAEYLQKSIDNMYENRHELYRQVVETPKFKADLEDRVERSLKVARTSELREIVSADLVQEANHQVELHFAQGLDVIKKMYQDRNEVYVKRIKLAVALLSTALSVVNASGVANLAGVVTEEAATRLSQATRLVQSGAILPGSMLDTPYGDTLSRTREVSLSAEDPTSQLLTIATLGITIGDSLRQARNDARESPEAYSQEAVIDYAKDLSEKIITMYSEMYDAYQEISPQVVEKEVNKQLVDHAEAIKEAFEHIVAKHGYPNITDVFMEKLTDQIVAQIRKPYVIRLDPTIHTLAKKGGQYKTEILKGIRLYALSNIYCKGKFDGKIEGRKLNTMNDWQKVRMMLGSGILKADTADSTKVIFETLNQNFPELSGNYQARFAYNAALPTKFNNEERKWCRYLREGWVTANGQANAFIENKGKLSPFSLTTADWKELLGESTKQNLIHVTGDDFNHRSAVFTVTPATLVVACPHYRHAFKSSIENYEAFRRHYNEILTYPQAKREVELSKLHNRMEVAGINIKTGSSVRQTLDSMRKDLDSLADTLKKFNDEGCHTLASCNNPKQVSTLVNMMSDHIVLLNRLDPAKAEESLDLLVRELTSRIESMPHESAVNEIKDLENLLTILNNEKIGLGYSAQLAILKATTTMMGEAPIISKLLDNNELYQEKDKFTANPIHEHHPSNPRKTHGKTLNRLHQDHPLNPLNMPHPTGQAPHDPGVVPAAHGADVAPDVVPAAHGADVAPPQPNPATHFRDRVKNLKEPTTEEEEEKQDISQKPSS